MKAWQSAHKGYTSTPTGQVHWRAWGEPQGESARDLYCFHPSPLSGLAFDGLGPVLAEKRRVIAPDYPGFGGSDPLPGKPSIEGYAAAMADTIISLSGDRPVDLLGFHTGCLVAAELASKRPDETHAICLIDVPAFDEDATRTMRAKYAEPFTLGIELETLAPVWASTFGKRVDTQGVDSAFAYFAEHLRAGVRMNEAFQAAFDYDWATRFAEIRSPTMVLATKSPLLEPSRAAAREIEGARCIEKLEITRSVLNEAANTTAAEVDRFLEEVGRARSTRHQRL